MTKTLRVGLDGRWAARWSTPLLRAAKECGVDVDVVRLRFADIAAGEPPRPIDIDLSCVWDGFDGVILAGRRRDALSHLGEAGLGRGTRNGQPHLLLVPPVRWPSQALRQCREACVLELGYPYQPMLEAVAEQLVPTIGVVRQVSATWRSLPGRTPFQDELTMLLMCMMPLLDGIGSCDEAMVDKDTLRARIALGDVQVGIEVAASPIPGQLPELCLVGAGGRALIGLELDEFNRQPVRPILQPSGGRAILVSSQCLSDLRTTVVRRWLEAIVGWHRSVDAGATVGVRFDVDFALRVMELVEQIVGRPGLTPPPHGPA